MDNKYLERHISHTFDTEIDTIISQILAMGSLVEQQIQDSVTAIISTDKALAEKVIDVENEVDKREMRIDEICTQVLACRQPAASDLRLILSATRIIRDLEHIGDEAHKVAKMALRLEKKGAAPGGYDEVALMGALVQEMLNCALNAYSDLDVAQALDVAKTDKKVDRELKSAMRTVVTCMIDNPKSIKRAMNISSALRSLERMGNHSRNIAEHVIYLVKGLDVRHSSIKEIANKLKD